MFQNGHWSSREFSYIFAPKSMFLKLKISTFKISSVISKPRLERGFTGLPFEYSSYSILFLICMFQNSHWSSREFSYIFAPKSNFLKLKISTFKISSVIKKPRLERWLSRLPFAYSLYCVLFLICMFQNGHWTSREL